MKLSRFLKGKERERESGRQEGHRVERVLISIICLNLDRCFNRTSYSSNVVGNYFYYSSRYSFSLTDKDVRLTIINFECVMVL